MIRMQFLICALAFGAVAAASAVTEGLVAYWDFDEGGGDMARDLTGNGHDGVLVGKADWAQGRFNGALEFDEPLEYVAVPDHPELDLSDAVTYMAHFKPMDSLASRRLMVKNDSIFVIFDFGNVNSIDFLVKPTNTFAESATTDWTIDNWYHFAGTFDGSHLRIYVDGKLDGEKPNGEPIMTSDKELWIGADDFGRPSDSFPGAIDDVRIYNRALNEREIQDAMSGPLSVDPRRKSAVVWATLKR